MKKFFINVQGGTGLNVSLTQVIADLKEKNPDEYEFNVMSPYSDLFQCCDGVENVYTPNQAREFLFDAKAADAEIVTTRLYDISDFIYKRMNYKQAWLHLLGIKYDKKTQPSDLTTKLNPLAKFPAIGNQVKEVEKTIKENGFDDFVIMQFYGGQSPLVSVPLGTDEKGNKFPDWSKVPYNGDNEPLQRHYPSDMANKFIQLFKQEHPKTAVVMFQLPNEPRYDGTFVFTVPYLAYYELAKSADCRGIVAIDSCLHHLVAGITKAVVLWGHSEPSAFGYDYQKNIIQDCRRDDIIYMSMLGPCANKIRYIKPEALLKEVGDELFNEVVEEANA